MDLLAEVEEQLTDVFVALLDTRLDLLHGLIHHLLIVPRER